MPSMGRVLVRNALVAALLSVPIALVVFSVVARAVGASDESSLLDLTVLFPWLAMLAAAGAVVFTVGLDLARRRGMIVTRGRALLFAPLLVLPWLLVPARGLLLYPPFVVGALAGLGVLLVAVKLPTAPDAGTGG